MALDGIENIVDGELSFTEVLLEKVKCAFKTELPKTIVFSDADKVAKYIIERIILPWTEGMQ